MSSKTFTDKYLSNLAPEIAQFTVWDQKIRNLGLRVSPSGTKAFTFLYKIRGRTHRLGLGRYPTVSLSDARSKAREALNDIAKEIDPRLKKLGVPDHSNPLLKNAALTFTEIHLKGHRVRWEETARVLERHIVKKLGSFTISDIQKHHLKKIFETVRCENGPSAANHLFSVTRNFFNWSIEEGMLTDTPMRGMKKPAREVNRDRVLTDAELIAIWNAASVMSYPYGNMVRILMLTGQRRSEVSEMRWSDIDFFGKVWTQPATSNKSKRKHVVPLSDDVIAILNATPRIHDDLVFPARGANNPISGFSKWKRKLDTLCGVEEWTIHDIRRTVATKMGEDLSIPPHTIEMILNHESRIFSDIVRRYNHAEYKDDKRRALVSWASYLTKLNNAPSALLNVAPVHP